MSDHTNSGLSRRFSRATPRQRLLALFGLVVLVAAIAWGVYWFLYLRNFASTDDSYVAGDVIQVTSRISGSVLSVHADNTQMVRAGTLLVEIDPINAQIGVEAAEADLARTVRSVRALFAKAEEQRAQLSQARVELSRAQTDLQRRVAASGTGAVSAEDLTHARDAASQASASVTAYQSALDQTLAQIQGTNIADNPDVLAAEARLRDAVVTLNYARIEAPASGVVAQRSAQVGQQVSQGTILMAIVPLANVWIDANFKEVQLKSMRIGQRATVTADIYGGSVTYHGRVAGLAPGSGVAFALLPPQNATGNWIKIVQRVPVRIELDARELEKHPLRIGLSADATVDLRDQSGPLVSETVRPRVPSDTTTGKNIAAVNATIARIVVENAGSQP